MKTLRCLECTSCPPFFSIGILTSIYFIPYPENLKSKVIVTSNHQSEKELVTFISYTELSRIKEGMPVLIEIEEHSSSTHEYLKGFVKTISPQIIRQKGKRYFQITLCLNYTTEYDKIEEGMEGTATLLLYDRSLIQYLCAISSL